MQTQDLVYCETFYSIQGEGPSVGRPAIFLRLAGCNLQCTGFSYRDPKTGEHLGCDTKAVWRQAKRISHESLLEQWKELGYLAALDKGARLILTGGEPTLQQEKCIVFFEKVQSLLSKPLIIELETNATRRLQTEFLQWITQINASPKLCHSGESREKAYCHEVLVQLAHAPQALFKFVVASQSDIEEILINYVEALQLDLSRVWLMPEGGTRTVIQERSLWLVELCKQYGMNYSPRLHIHLWNEATGV